jgi:hypothetical protein
MRQRRARAADETNPTVVWARREERLEFWYKLREPAQVVGAGRGHIVCVRSSRGARARIGAVGGLKVMAKIIRCPNCGENVEIPPNPTGQMVTCISCGTVLRLKSRKAAQQEGDQSHGSIGGASMGGATTIVQPSDRSSSDDPPSLGSECEVCGQSFDPSELVEDRGKLTCRACMKKQGKPTGGITSRMARNESAAMFDFAEAGPTRPRRGKMITFGPPFFGGAFAAVLVIACNAYLAFNPKPAGSKVVQTTPADNPPVSSETDWDKRNRPTIEQLMSEGNALKQQEKLADAKAKFDAVVAMAKGQAIGSQEMRRMVDLAEQESESLASSLAAAATPTTPAPPSPPPPVAQQNPPPPGAGVEVPDNVAPKEGSVFDDVEVAIIDKLNAGVQRLENALAQPGDAATNPAKEALVTFSEARGLLIKEKRNTPQDPAWSLSNHGTAIAYTLLRNYGFAIDYLDRLPTPPDRAALINRVVVLLQTRENKAEAIQMLLGHLHTEAGADDTYALNLLGTTLARYSDDVIQKEKPLADAHAEYEEFVKKLATKHPGEKRWGIRWIPASEYEANLKTQANQRQRMDFLEKQLAIVRGKITKYETNTTQIGQSILREARDSEQRYTGELDKLRTELKTEEWLTPEQIVPVLPDVSAVNAQTQATSTTKPAAG